MDHLIRPQYYDGEYLGADDLTALVRYTRSAQARHQLGVHTWGIAVGLDLAERVLAGGDVEMVLTPGVAWDGYGRTIAALAPQRVSLSLFADFQDDTVATGVPVEVWLAYRELPASPPGVGFACPDDDLHGRIFESFTIELRRAPVTDSHIVSIADRSIDAMSALKAFDVTRPPLYDESAAQQKLPDSGNTPRWPIFVGIVRWRKDVGQPGRLIQRIDDDRNNARKNRRYTGAVAETIYAPDGVLRLRDRSKDPADPQVNYTPPIVAPALAPGAKSPNDLVWCEGNLRVVGDARLQGGLLDYRLTTGGDGGIPMHLRRISPDAVTTSTSMDAFVGPPPPLTAGTLTRFTISTDDPAKPRECLTLVTQRGGTKLAEVGINSSQPTNTLHVTGPTGIRYGFAYVTGDAGSATSAFAFNAYMTPGGTWVLGDPAHQAAAALVLDDNGGVPQLRFQTSKTGNPALWDVNVVVKGDTGNMGIGTAAPTAKLQVHSANPLQGEVQLFSATADFEYDGGSDKTFIFRDSAGGKTAFIGGDFGIGAVPISRVHVAQDAHLNAVFDRTDVQEHLTAVVGSVGSGLRFSNTNDFFIGSQTYANRADGTFGTEHLRIRPNGNVGINNSLPAVRLHVTGDRIRLGDASKRIDLRTDGSQVDLHSETHHLYIRTAGNAGKRNVIINPDNNLEGNVGIGTTSPGSKLDVEGDMSLNGAAFINAGVWVASDARQKRAVRAIAKPLEKLLALQGVSYAWRDPALRGSPAAREHGFLAQEVEAVFPDWVRETPKGTKTVNLAAFNAVAVEAIRELAERCDRLEKEISDLRAMVSAAGPKSSGSVEASTPAEGATRPSRRRKSEP
jgi:Chaperone of endosialidase